MALLVFALTSERDGRVLAEVLTRHSSGVDDKLGKMACCNDDVVEVLVVAMLLPVLTAIVGSHIMHTGRTHVHTTAIYRWQSSTAWLPLARERRIDDARNRTDRDGYGQMSADCWPEFGPATTDDGGTRRPGLLDLAAL
jgi:hypothetical protein